MHRMDLFPSNTFLLFVIEAANNCSYFVGWIINDTDLYYESFAMYGDHSTLNKTIIIIIILL